MSCTTRFGAKRAASQLRANLLRLQELSLRFCEHETSRDRSPACANFNWRQSHMQILHDEFPGTV